MERIIGEINGTEEGPLLIFVAGLHGNEEQGIIALENIFRHFNYRGKVAGRAIALRGNLEAIRQNIRYVSQDLNRIWDVKHYKRAVDYHAAEVYELLALREIIEAEIAKKYCKTYLIDLHTTSAPTIPFAVTKLSKDNQYFMEQMGVPYITNLKGFLDGTMLAWMCEKGHGGLAFEAGQHFSQQSMIKHEAFVRLAMYQTGFTPDISDTDIKTLKHYMNDELKPKHNHFELRLRYKIDEEEDFVMQPGFANFQRIFKGQVLAKNNKGDVLSPLDGNIFMPLYQKQGNDGFFVIQPVEN